jgi:hypothetical protein
MQANGSDAADRIHAALELSEREDDLALSERAARRQFWLRLMPGLSLTAFWFSQAALSVGEPALVLGLACAVYTARATRTQSRHRARLRALRAELDGVSTGALEPPRMADDPQA